MELISHCLLFFNLYLFLCGNIVSELYDSDMRNYLKTNLFAKHTIAIVLLFIFYISRDKNLNESNIFKTILSVILIYIWFILTTKTPFKITIAIISLVTTIYILNKYNERYKSELEKKHDPELQKRMTTIRCSQIFLAIVTFIITIIGNIIYITDKSNN